MYYQQLRQIRARSGNFVADQPANTAFELSHACGKIVEEGGATQGWMTWSMGGAALVRFVI